MPTRKAVNGAHSPRESQSKQAQASVLHRYLSGLRADHELCYALQRGKKTKNEQRWEPLHLQQSPLDRACGLHACLMFAMLVTGLPRTSAIRVASSSRAGLKRLWAAARPSYFRGVRAAEVMELVTAIAPELKVHRIKDLMTDVLAQAIAAVEQDHVALLMVGNASRSYMHWVLVVGVEYEEIADTSSKSGKSRKLVPTALLALDPESPAPVMCHFNWRMNLRGPGAASRMRACLSSDGSEANLTLIEGVVVERSAGGADSM